MAKGPLITDRKRGIIGDVYLEHRDWRAKQVQDEVNRRMNGNGPGLSAVQKELTKIRKRDAEISSESSELDMPWTTFSMAKYPVAPEAVPILLKLAIWVLEHRHSTLTINQAQWAARLYTTTTDMQTLYEVSKNHVSNEKVAKMCDIPLHYNLSDDLSLYTLITGDEVIIQRIMKPLTLTERERIFLKEVFSQTLYASNEMPEDYWEMLKKKFKDDFGRELNEKELEIIRGRIRIIKAQGETDERSHSKEG